MHRRQAFTNFFRPLPLIYIAARHEAVYARPADELVVHRCVVRERVAPSGLRAELLLSSAAHVHGSLHAYFMHTSCIRHCKNAHWIDVHPLLHVCTVHARPTVRRLLLQRGPIARRAMQSHPPRRVVPLPLAALALLATGEVLHETSVPVCACAERGNGAWRSVCARLLYCAASLIPDHVRWPAWRASDAGSLHQARHAGHGSLRGGPMSL